MALKGTIEDIVYRNDENGYTVARLEKDDGVVTVVGKFIDVQVGANVTLEGKFERNKFGVQYAFTSYEISMPKSIAGIEKYLGSGLIKGVGPITAKKIVERFGADTLDILEYSPQKLAQINGISEKKAIEIGFSFKEHREVQNTIMFLQNYNISTHMALKIYNVYREKTTDIVKNNPYKLVEDIDGIGFASADKIAQNAGIYNDWRKQRDAYATQAIADTRANEGAAQQMRDSAIRDAYEFVAGRRNDRMRLAMMEPLAKYAFDDDTYKKIYSRAIV